MFCLDLWLEGLEQSIKGLDFWLVNLAFCLVGFDF